MSSRFFVVLFVAALVVVAPSLVLIRALWRRGGFARALLIVGFFLVAMLAVVFLIPSSWPSSYEERTVMFLVAWGAVFSLVGTVALVAAIARHAIETRSPSKQ